VYFLLCCCAVRFYAIMANRDEYISAAKYVVDSIIMYILWKRSQNVSIWLTLSAVDDQPAVFTFRVSRRPREMYCGHARLCVCLSVCLSAVACPHYCTDSDVTWGSGRGCPLVVHYWTDLQSVHGMRCYDNIMDMRGRAQR